MTKNMIDALKELYSDGKCPSNAKEDKYNTFIHQSRSGYFFESELEALLDDTPKSFKFKDLVYNKNPFLDVIPKNEFSGVSYPIPVITGSDNE